MIRDNLGRCVLDTADAMEYLYQGGKLENANLSAEAVQEFNNTIDKLKLQSKLSTADEVSKEVFDQNNQSNWYFPEQYKNLDIEKHIKDLAETEQQLARVEQELELYKKFNLYTVLRYLVYLIDTMRNNNIVWGVGRGSSVSSYVLFLMGVHKVDSIKYGLDIHEFLR